MTGPEDTASHDLGAPTERVRVTSPRTDAMRQRRTTAASEIDAQTDLGEVYMTSLLRAQGRLAVQVLGVVVVVVGGLPLALRLESGLTTTMVLGMPLSWVVLAFGIYPVLWGLAWYYVRAAERNERDFVDVVERD